MQAVQKKKFTIGMVVPYFLLIICVVIALLPIISMVGTSFKSKAEIYSTLSIFPSFGHASLEFYQQVLSNGRFFGYFSNSFVVAVLVTFVSTFIAVLGGYSLSRYRRRYPVMNAYVIFLLALQMFPVIQLIIPLYLIFQGIGITNTRLSVFIAYSTFTLPLAIWLLQSFFDGIPFELEEAGRIDGCGRLQCLFRLVMPVSGPGLASVAIFAFNYCWNEYLLSSLFLKDDRLRTLPLGLRTFMQENTTDWGSLMAASTVTILPVLIFLIFMQKHIVVGLTAGAVKG